MNDNLNTSSADLVALFKELMTGHIGSINTGHTFEVSDDLIARIEDVVATVPQAVQAPIIPEWLDVSEKMDRGEKRPALETFVNNNEPAGNEDEAKFRSELQAMLNEVAAPIVATGDLSTTVPSDTEYGWLVENGRDVPDLRYRTMGNSGITWTDDHNKALRFARRADAEMFAAEDEDAWRIVQHGWDNAAPSPTEQASDVHNAALTVDIEQMVNRFLSWKLPQTFAPDCGILFKQVYADSWPTGTNLFHAGEAKAMFQHCLGIPAAKGNAPDEVKS